MRGPSPASPPVGAMATPETAVDNGGVPPAEATDTSTPPQGEQEAEGGRDSIVEQVEAEL
eukprot:4710200-Pyramimonas_sp.AAC.1